MPRYQTGLLWSGVQTLSLNKPHKRHEFPPQLLHVVLGRAPVDGVCEFPPVRLRQPTGGFQRVRLKALVSLVRLREVEKVAHGRRWYDAVLKLLEVAADGLPEMGAELDNGLQVLDGEILGGVDLGWTGYWGPPTSSGAMS